MLSGKERLLEIVRIIKKYDLIKHATPQNLRLAIEEAGPTFIKLGQILASRDDVIPKEYCDELSHLRNQVKPMPYEKVLEILDIEEEIERIMQYLRLAKDKRQAPSIVEEDFDRD